MRIESLSIERYGIHADRRFDFAPGLQVIYGPNEAGKTTLLQLVRDLFFGYDVRHRYRFEEHSGPLKAGAACVTREGRRFQFSRQKGRPDLVTGEFAGAREPLDADKLDRLIGGISPTTYQQIFAFSLKELQQGGELLKEAGLHRALFGVGMGGLPQLQALQQRVRKEQLELLNTHGAAKKQVINDLLIQIQRARELHKQSTLRPHEYTRQVENLKRHEEQAADLRSRLEELRQEQNRLLRYQKALPIFRECALLYELLAALPQTGSYPADAVERFAKLNARRHEFESEIARLDEDEAAPGATANALDDERLLKAAGEIRTLHGRHAALAHQAGQQQALLNRIAEARRELDAQLQSLPAEWSNERFSAFDHATPDVELLEQIAGETNQLRLSLERIESESNTLTARVESLVQALEEVPEDARQPALESLLEAREQEWKARNRLKQVQSDISRLCDQLDVQRQALAAGTTWSANAPDDIEALLEVSTPLPSAVAEFDRDWRKLEADRDELAASLKRQQAELKQAVRKLEELRQVREIPDPSRLPLLRARRDELWTSLRRRISGGESPPSEPATVTDDLIHDFQRTVDDCDAFADELLRSADDVAHQTRLQADVVRLQQRVDESAATVAGVEQAIAGLARRWSSLWAAAGITPHCPAVMQDWLSQLAAFRRLHADLLTLEREELDLESSVAGMQRELTRAFPEAVDFDDAWRQAQQRRDQLRTASADRVRLLKEHHDARGLLTSLEQQQFDGTLKLAELQQRGNAIAERYGFPRDWDAGTSWRTLQALRDASRRRNDLTQWEALLVQQGREWDRFRNELAALLKRIAPDLNSPAETDALAEIESRLAAAESRVEQRRQLAERQTNAERDRLACLRKQQELAALFEELAGECGAAVSELPRFMIQITDAADTHARLAGLQSQLSAVLQPGEGEETLAEQDVDLIAGRLRGIDDDVRHVQDDLSAAQQQVGVMRHELQQWELDAKPLQTAAELASLQARLAHAVDQWAPLTLADALMTAARERFQKLHQPRLIAQVERIFNRMTAGEYEQIVCSLDQNADEPITVRHRDGKQRTTEQLSSGTSEQLYLAIRLAYVADYSRLSEPMPMVMDDVLVNFDEQRALETLSVLLELAESSQIFFLTCHRRTIDLLRQLRTDSSIIELNGSLTLPDDDVPLHDEVRLEHDAHKSSRRPKRRMERPDQPALFPPGN